MSSKKAFDTNYTSNPVFSPEEIVIIGGKCLPKDEQGPYDTDHKQGEHELWDRRLETVSITDAEVANVDYYGVLQNPVIRKDPVSGRPILVAGRGRIRRARRANKLRAARGAPLIEITCTIDRPSKDDPNRLIGVMIAENAVRNDDGPLVKLEKAKALMASGVSEARAALTFGLDPEYFAMLLAYDDNATAEVKEAVAKGDLSPTAAVEMVRATKTPDHQRKALETVRANKKAGKPATVRAATEAAKRATGKVSDEGAGIIPSRRELAHVLKAISKIAGPEVNEARVLIDDEHGKSNIEPAQGHTVDAFFIGAEAALKLVFGRCEDKTLLVMLAKARKEASK